MTESIESLKAELAAAKTKTAAAQAETAKANAEAVEAKAEAVKAKAEAVRAKAETAKANAEAVKAKAEAVEAKTRADESEINQKANLLLIRDHGLNLVLPPTQTTVAGKRFHLQNNEHILGLLMRKLKSLLSIRNTFQWLQRRRE